MGSARAVIDVCNAHRIRGGAPRGARRRGADRSRAARRRAHHLVRRRPRASLQAEVYRQPSCATTTRAATAAIACSAPSISMGPKRGALRRQTAASVGRCDARRVRAARRQAGRRHERRTGGGAGGRIPQDAAADAPPVARGRSHCHGRPHRVPFAARGEAPWLELLVDSGFTPLEAIAAATTPRPASVSRQGARRASRRAAGGSRRARRQPAADISAIRKVERVMVAGRWVDVGSALNGPTEQLW